MVELDEPFKNVVVDGTLYDFVMFLCKLHNYEPSNVHKEALSKVHGIDQYGESILVVNEQQEAKCI